MARSLQHEALAGVACEPEDKKESTEKGKGREQSGKSELALTAGKRGEGWRVARLPRERLKVSLIFPTITPPPPPSSRAFYSEN